VCMCVCVPRGALARVDGFFGGIGLHNTDVLQNFYIYIDYVVHKISMYCPQDAHADSTRDRAHRFSLTQREKQTLRPKV
jgi:hypothetical protein